MADEKYDDHVQHGIDDDPNNDPKKARNIGGVGGAVTGAIAGAPAGPLGVVGGAIIGAVAGGLGSQAAVAAVDKVDNDNTVTGIGSGATTDVEDQARNVAHGGTNLTATNQGSTTGMTGTTGQIPQQPNLNSAGLQTTQTNVPTGQQQLREGEKLEVIEENLAVGKREVETGGVRINSYVTEQPVTEQVNLREEHVHVERHAVDRPANPNEIESFKEATIEMREHAEVPVVAKEARVVEEIGINKTVEQRTETIQDTVRQTHVDIEPLAFDETWSRSDWQTRFGSTGGSWDTYRPAYEYGNRVAADSRYQGRDFSVIESDLRNDYERQYPGQWQTHRSAIESSFNQSRTGMSGRAYADNPVGNGVPGIQTGGRNNDGSPDTRGITEKLSDAVTGDRIDDKTGKRI